MIRLRLLPLLLASLLGPCVALAEPVSSAFTYQGQLSDAGAPANGIYDFEFALYGSATAGNVLDTVNAGQLQVSQGLVSAAVDFSDLPYDGQALWIEVRVRQSGSGDAFTTLTPRQAITAAPYALYALNAPARAPGGGAGTTTAAAANSGAQAQAAQPKDLAAWTLPYTGSTTAAESSPAAAFSIFENGGGLAIYGQATNAAGVRGVSTSGNGVRGDSALNNGVYGIYSSGSGYAAPTRAGVVGDSPVNGVYGQSSAPSFQVGAALTGVDTNGGPGLYSYVIAPGGTSVLATNDSSNDQGDVIQGWHKGFINFHVTALGVATATQFSVTGPTSGFGTLNSAFQGTTYGAGPTVNATNNGSGAAVKGVNTTTNGNGVVAINSATSLGSGAGIYAQGNLVSRCPADINGDSLCEYGGAGVPALDVNGDATFSATVFTQSLDVHDSELVENALFVNGDKNFVEPHPTDATKQIVFTALEGPESGTYFRGTGQLVNGETTIDVPEAFRLTTSPDNMTVQVTAVGEFATLAVISQDLSHIVVRGTQDVKFHYLVNGVRAGFENHKTIVANTFYIPKDAQDGRFSSMPAETVRRLKATGILNRDGSVNVTTAHRLHWDESPLWKAAAQTGTISANAQ